jgi:hypothetical protein
MEFFAVAGASLYVSRHSGEPLTDDHPGNSFTFTRGRSVKSRSMSVASPTRHLTATPARCSVINNNDISLI